MKQKSTIASIFYRLFVEVRSWHYDKIPDSIPPMIRDTPIIYYNVWKTVPVMRVDYETFHFLVLEVLKVTSQDRIVRQRWNEMIKLGYLTTIGDSGAFNLHLDMIRPLFGEPNPSTETVSPNEHSAPVSTEAEV